jgi:Na+-transporting NADH:ubiquinone oxidoreductase subunit C
MPKETIGKTFAVAAGVCVVCSVLVSAAAVSLKPLQELNKTRDINKNILIAAGLLQPGQPISAKDVETSFRNKISERWVDLDTGEFVAEKDVPPECRDERKAEKDTDPKCSEQIHEAGLTRRVIYQRVYITPKQGSLQRIVLPVHGKGLWSTMYGFLALGRDLNTVKRFAFYEHGETPGLGGEVDNPAWQKCWVGKLAYGPQGRQPMIRVVKGRADPRSTHDIDGLSGATLTSRGVQNLVCFWLSEEGYGKFLQKLRQTLQKQTRGEQHG